MSDIAAIKAALDQAYAQQAEAQREIKRLTVLLISASETRDMGEPAKFRHWWPMGESRPMCGTAERDVTGDPKGVTCRACLDSVPAAVVRLLRGEPPP